MNCGCPVQFSALNTLLIPLLRAQCCLVSSLFSISTMHILMLVAHCIMLTFVVLKFTVYCSLSAAFFTVYWILSIVLCGTDYYHRQSNGVFCQNFVFLHFLADDPQNYL